MSTRTRSRRTYGRAPLKLSQLNPANIDMVKASIVCPDCDTWRRVVGKTDLKVVSHERGTTDHCPGGNRRVEVDLTPDRWLARLRRQHLDALSAETRRAATQHYKPLPAQPGPVHLMATARPEADEPTASQRNAQARRRTAQWKTVVRTVKDVDSERAEPLVGAIGPIRGIEVPTETLHPTAA
ncbi:hypothetical protein ACFWA9_38615 [Kitasatospora sp. NPDC059973]|uniref:hypothetical protein n=1 Tax=Kitasatospora sp. NPDC059973 TaxID=3347020 RepID=UPI0036762355